MANYCPGLWTILNSGEILHFVGGVEQDHEVTYFQEPTSPFLSSQFEYNIDIDSRRNVFAGGTIDASWNVNEPYGIIKLLPDLSDAPGTIWLDLTGLIPNNGNGQLPGMALDKSDNVYLLSRRDAPNIDKVRLHKFGKTASLLNQWDLTAESGNLLTHMFLTEFDGTFYWAQQIAQFIRKFNPLTDSDSSEFIDISVLGSIDAQIIALPQGLFICVDDGTVRQYNYAGVLIRTFIAPPIGGLTNVGSIALGPGEHKDRLWIWDTVQVNPGDPANQVLRLYEIDTGLLLQEVSGTTFVTHTVSTQDYIYDMASCYKGGVTPVFGTVIGAT